MITLAHFSDIHVTSPRLDWRRTDWFSKRAPGWINHRVLGRGFRFRKADLVLARLMREMRERRPDHLVFSGDATAMGFESEMQKAAQLLGLGDPSSPPGLAVPGNHDYYTIRTAASGVFEKHFQAWQQGTRVDDSPYPFAQRIGDCYLIGLNTSTGNRMAWDATGKVRPDQLERLKQLLAMLPPGPRIVVTHYPVCLRTGRKEHVWHSLRNRRQVVEVAEKGGVSLWLHGHRHDAYQLEKPALAGFPIICAGSATQSGKWSYGEYKIEGHLLRGVRRVFDVKEGKFRDGATFELRLGG